MTIGCQIRFKLYGHSKLTVINKLYNDPLCEQHLCSTVEQYHQKCGGHFVLWRAGNQITLGITSTVLEITLHSAEYP